MSIDFHNQIFKEEKLAYAIFDQDFFLYKYSQNFAKTINIPAVNKTNNLWEIFPELIGSEDEVVAVSQKNKSRYKLEKLGKYSENGKIWYYDLTLLPLRNGSHSRQLLCIVSDTTKMTSLQQKIQQQVFEIQLLQTNLLKGGQKLSTGIIGDSPAIQKVKNFIDKVCNYPNTTILLQGESGTGKNLVARAIHNSSLQATTPFIEINCASIPATLIESEIFGYEKGAFTNALSRKEGLLDSANGGTLFLDEIGELPLELQAKFLSFLETKTFRRLGSTQEQKVDVRIIAATNKDLKQAAEKQEFRQDLFYRISVVTLNLPPLRELQDDITPIAENFISVFAFDFGKKVSGLSERAKEKLRRYPWPGNVRELRNVIERAVIFAEKDHIDADDIILVEERPEQSSDKENNLSIASDGASFLEIEKKLILDALEKTRGNQTRAAKSLGLTLDTLRYRIKKHKISL